MKKLQISPSLLNDFYCLVNDKYSFTEQRMLDSINRVKSPSTEAQERGKNFEQAVMDRLPFEVVPELVMQRFYNETEGGIWQPMVKHHLQVNDINVEFIGFIDCLMPGVVKDIKTTSQYEFGKYAGNFQSVIYMLSTGCDQVDYLVTDFKDFYKESYTLSGDMVRSLEDHTRWLLSWMESKSELIDWSKRLTEINLVK